MDRWLGLVSLLRASGDSGMREAMRSRRRSLERLEFGMRISSATRSTKAWVQLL